jgi:hypothetical protein
MLSNSGKPNLVIRDGSRAPANKVVYETIVQSQFVASGALFGAGIFEVIGGASTNSTPRRAIATGSS